LYGQRFRDEPALATAACTLTIAAAILLPPALIVDQPWTLRPSAEALAIALALGLFSTGLAFLIYFRLIRTLGSLGVASQAYLRAAVALAIGVLILGETLSWSAAAGVALAIAGVAAINAPVGLFKRRGDPR
ncbi:MAG: EamA family transporter, partial [Pseudomonadota bacterium]